MRIPKPTLLILPVALFLVSGCDVDVEEQGEMPSVDVDAQPGQLPEYEVTQEQEAKLPSVDVDSDPGKLPKVDVRGPDVDVGVDAVAVPVPDIDVDLPSDQDPQDAKPAAE